MKTTLEEELISALRARVAALPTDESEKLRSGDDHPRRHRRAAACGTRSHCCGRRCGGNRTGDRFRWGRSRLRGLERCANRGLVFTVVAGGAELPGPPSSTSLPAASSALGPGSPCSLTCVARSRWRSTRTTAPTVGCFTSSSFTQVTQVSSDGDTSNGVLKVSGSGSANPSQGLSTVTVGGTTSAISKTSCNRISPRLTARTRSSTGESWSGVTGVTLVLDHGQDVVATVADGWLLAWWPSDALNLVAGNECVRYDVRNSGLIDQGTANAPRPRLLHADHDPRRNERDSPLHEL